VAGPKAVTQYEAVRERIGAGLSVGDAIKAVAETLDVKPGTVHTNYYRMAREAGTVARRRTRTPSRISESSTPSAAEIQQAMNTLAHLARRVAELEEDSKQLAAIRRTLTDTP
jgi:hypothetical protein